MNYELPTIGYCFKYEHLNDMQLFTGWVLEIEESSNAAGKLGFRVVYYSVEKDSVESMPGSHFAAHTTVGRFPSIPAHKMSDILRAHAQQDTDGVREAIRDHLEEPLIDLAAFVARDEELTHIANQELHRRREEQSRIYKSIFQSVTSGAKNDD